MLPICSLTSTFTDMATLGLGCFASCLAYDSGCQDLAVARFAMHNIARQTSESAKYRPCVIHLLAFIAPCTSLQKFTIAELQSGTHVVNNVHQTQA